MSATKVFLRGGVHQRFRFNTETLLEDLDGVGTGNRVHGVEAHAEQAGIDQALNAIEVKQVLHEFGVIGYRVNNFDNHGAEFLFTRRIQVKLGTVCNQVALDLLTLCVNSFGNIFRRRPAVGNVVLDAEVAIGSSRVMAGGQDDAAKCLVLANDAGHCRCGK